MGIFQHPAKVSSRGQFFQGLPVEDDNFILLDIDHPFGFIFDSVLEGLADRPSFMASWVLLKSSSTSRRLFPSFAPALRDPSHILQCGGNLFQGELLDQDGKPLQERRKRDDHVDTEPGIPLDQLDKLSSGKEEELAVVQACANAGYFPSRKRDASAKHQVLTQRAESVLFLQERS